MEGRLGSDYIIFCHMLGESIFNRLIPLRYVSLRLPYQLLRWQLMTKLMLEIPDELMTQLEHSEYSVQDIVVKALERYIQAEAIAKTSTWQLCGTLEVSNPAPEYIVGRDEKGEIITNYAEKVDDVLY